jgi:hypothetical protein
VFDPRELREATEETGRLSNDDFNVAEAWWDAAQELS